MILRQFLHSDPVIAASYLVGCAGKGVSAVVDPMEDIEQYIEVSEASGMTIRYVIDTHVHADHISGGARLAEATGATYVLGRRAATTIPHDSVSEGDVLLLGNVELNMLETPGHTPEHITIAVVDRTRGDEPWCLLTGHTLMVGDLGRTELASSAEEGARHLYASVEKLRALADHLVILPGAYAGSECGRGLSGNPVSTLGFERRFNAAFAIDTEEAFVEHMLEHIPLRPPQADAIRSRNLGVSVPASSVGS